MSYTNYCKCIPQDFRDMIYEDSTSFVLTAHCKVVHVVERPHIRSTNIFRRNFSSMALLLLSLYKLLLWPRHIEIGPNWVCKTIPRGERWNQFRWSQRIVSSSTRPLYDLTISAFENLRYLCSLRRRDSDSFDGFIRSYLPVHSCFIIWPIVHVRKVGIYICRGEEIQLISIVLGDYTLRYTHTLWFSHLTLDYVGDIYSVEVKRLEMRWSRRFQSVIPSGTRPLFDFAMFTFKTLGIYKTL